MTSRQFKKVKKKENSEKRHLENARYALKQDAGGSDSYIIIQ